MKCSFSFASKIEVNEQKRKSRCIFAQLPGKECADLLGPDGREDLDGVEGEESLEVAKCRQNS